ncbi:MAG TPA: family 16 glycosylhydrolase, partial [Gemmatimonadaceae bacterium]|nr:family 16 glycosylhydrolase [Gemmatimonadaceae bacterium]
MSRSSRARRVAALTLAAALAACADLATDPAHTPLAPEVALSNATAAPAFDDDFSRFDGARWSPQEHALGRGWFRAANVAGEPGRVRLVHPAGTLDGGEILSAARYGYGTYEAWIRTPGAPGTISAFFLYQGGARSDELDVEIFNDGSRRVMFTVWVAGVQQYTAAHVLPFDPADGVHRYTIDWQAGRVRFLVDGTLLQAWSHRRNVPRSAMYLMANAWWPVWIG